MLCPKCNNKLKLTQRTDWDSLVTYYYLICECGYTSNQISNNKTDITRLLNDTDIITRNAVMNYCM